MACEYLSVTVFEVFTDRETLEKALAKVQTDLGFDRVSFAVRGLDVAASTVAMNALKQAYQTEAAKLALKKRGFFTTETRNQNTGKITLTVRA